MQELSAYVAQLAVNSEGNVCLQVTARSTGEQHPSIPPMAFPGGLFQNAIAAEDYATSMLEAAGVITARVARAGLVWVSSGHTLVNGQRYAARRAPVPDLAWLPA